MQMRIRDWETLFNETDYAWPYGLTPEQLAYVLHAWDKASRRLYGEFSLEAMKLAYELGEIDHILNHGRNYIRKIAREHKLRECPEGLTLGDL